jgi:hypothetical protein
VTRARRGLRWSASDSPSSSRRAARRLPDRRGTRPSPRHCRSRTSASRSSTTTARCGTAFPRSSSARERARSRSWRSRSAWRRRQQRAVTRLAPEVGAELVAPCPASSTTRRRASPCAARRDRSERPRHRPRRLRRHRRHAVAEEAAVSAELMGNPVERLYDVGVAGLHRLLDRRERLWHAAVLIVVAGMRARCERRRRARRAAGDRGPDQRRLRNEHAWARGAPRHAQHLCRRRRRREHRQRLRCRVRATRINRRD